MRVLTASLLLLSMVVLRAENWSSWRGPSDNGTSTATDLPDTFDLKTATWKVELPGPAGSTPAVWDDRVYLTSADGDDLVLICVSTGGEMLWKETVTTGNQLVRSDEGNFASPSPSTDGEHVWAMFGNGVITCRDKDGKEVWTLDLNERYGKIDIAFGMTSTPVLDGDSLYVMCMYTGASYIACLDKRTGQERWKIDRVSDARDECEHSYASPMLYRDNQVEYLLAHGGDFCTAHSLKDGSEIWRFAYPVPVKRNHGMSRTLPAVTDEYIVSIGPISTGAPVEISVA